MAPGSFYFVFHNMQDSLRDVQLAHQGGSYPCEICRGEFYRGQSDQFFFFFFTSVGVSVLLVFTMIIDLTFIVMAFGCFLITLGT